jgi:hypothetical protein
LKPTVPSPGKGGKGKGKQEGGKGGESEEQKNGEKKKEGEQEEQAQEEEPKKDALCHKSTERLRELVSRCKRDLFSPDSAGEPVPPPAAEPEANLERVSKLKELLLWSESEGTRALLQKEIDALAAKPAQEAKPVHGNALMSQVYSGCRETEKLLEAMEEEHEGQVQAAEAKVQEAQELVERAQVELATLRSMLHKKYDEAEETLNQLEEVKELEAKRIREDAGDGGEESEEEENDEKSDWKFKMKYLRCSH